MYIILIFSFFLLLLGVSILLPPKRYFGAHLPFSIIIPCRNEEINLQTLLPSLDNIDYPDELFEIILIDDASVDGTPQIIAEYCRKRPNCVGIFIKNKDKAYPGKKFALKKGIEKAQFDNLLFTDADCEVPIDWLSSFAKYISKDIGMVVGYSPEKNINHFRRFTQILAADFYCATINCGMPFSNNGRNLYINKNAYKQVGGFDQIKNSICGEDKLLLNLIKKTKYKIKYNADCKVYTHPRIDDYKNQQKRRYGQFSLSSPLYKVISILIFLFYIYLPVYVILYKDWLSLSVYYLSFLLFWLAGLIKHKEKLYALDLFYILIYPYYLIYYSLIGMFGKWSWK